MAPMTAFWVEREALAKVRCAVLRCSDYENLIQASLHALPREACALLSARLVGYNAYLFVHFVKNNSTHCRQFRISLDLVGRVASEARRQGRILVGLFHSHPSNIPRPSPTDKQLARNISVIWLICAPQRPEMRAYISEEASFRAIELVQVSGTDMAVFQDRYRSVRAGTPLRLGCSGSTT